MDLNPSTLNSISFYILQEKIMHFPVWIDLKGQDSVPDTVHHTVDSVVVDLMCINIYFNQNKSEQ